MEVLDGHARTKQGECKGDMLVREWVQGAIEGYTGCGIRHPGGRVQFRRWPMQAE